MKPLHSILRQAPTAAAASRPAYFIMLALLTTGFLTVGGAPDDLVSLFLWRPLSVLLLSLAITAAAAAFSWHFFLRPRSSVVESSPATPEIFSDCRPRSADSLMRNWPSQTDSGVVGNDSD